MFIQKNQLIKAGITFSAAGLLFLANETEASANEFTSSNWQPTTVSQIEQEIAAQKESQGSDDVLKYTFQWGDTLWGISQATDISVDKLVNINDIDNRSLIHVGSTIYLSRDLSVISVQNGDEEVVSYDVSNGDAVETETPEEVEEAAEEAVVEEAVEEVVEQTQPAEETVVETQPEQPAEEPAEEEAAQTSSSENGRWMSVEATAYSRNQPVLSNHTFTGIDLRENSRVIAVDPDVIPLGSTIYVPGYGEYIAGDTGGAIIGNRIDIHFESLDSAIQFGRQNIDVQVFE
ncbi:3D domain-containing protein [Alkalibacterium pelagium]|uniref:3D (Asp-Asp-Asp) domain-containing protein n=1 Tax=Alkalibacterium pelagium TaxID=426702 RepID=A0A1H7EX96_9LACT|nr:3D domain-containing protein [Alkalibacterium pelagium]GEN49629.1 peptidase M23 [Alkalibacterium pelagium]SEK17717.1 3D (Asp-Asp-Asp) domain-containing protein [Alkalibacterium pelagium]